MAKSGGKTVAFGHPSQTAHMHAGIKAALKSKKTPAHLRSHLQARLASAPPMPFGGKPMKKMKPAMDEADSPMDANDNEDVELPMALNTGFTPNNKPLQKATKKTPKFPTKKPNFKMVKGNKIPGGFFG